MRKGAWSTYADRIWAGDETTVSEAREKYHLMSGTDLLSFASALYSFRWKRAYAGELLCLQGHLLRYAQSHCWARPRTGSTVQKVLAWMDRSDTLTTILEWMSRQSRTQETERATLRRVARALCEDSILHFPANSGSGHTLCLLELTSAALYLEAHDSARVRVLLRNVESHLEHVRDSNQRARILRKLGFLHRKNSEVLFGLYWGVRACFAPTVPMAVRLKSVAALFGVEL